MSELVLFGGLPGSGKSTKAENSRGHYLHYEADRLFEDCGGRYRFDFQLWQQARGFVWSLTDFALARDENVVVCDLFQTKRDVQEYESLAQYHDANLTMVWCESDHKTVHNIPITRMREIEAGYDGYFKECAR